ncbi:hypothetical protein M9Y10_033878 [Tritrichomonas musculus]|uniref:Uncharacterized protein n=1 Tax=Tritrichomonas musculus TaxID=1915356 RepID=A0ABR2KDC0_9EUKA
MNPRENGKVALEVAVVPVMEEEEANMVVMHVVLVMLDVQPGISLRRVTICGDCMIQQMLNKIPA